MSIFSKLGALIFAPTDAAGNPRQVINHDAQVWSTEVERIIQVALEGGDLLVYGSLSALNADLDHPANAGAILIGESIADDGLYMKQGTSGSGSWVKIGNVPGQGFVKVTNAGTGTENAIAATTPVAVNETQLILLPITAANTASPVTVAFNGGAALTVKTVSGNDVVVGGLPATSVMLGVIQGSVFRLLSDQTSAAIQAAAEAAQAAAEAARDEALGAVPNTFVPTRTAMKALDTSTKTSAFLTETGREGQFIWRSGDYSAEVAADTAEGIYIKADAIAASTGAWVREFKLPAKASWFGEDQAAIEAAHAVVDEILIDRSFAISSTATWPNGKTYLFMGDGVLAVATGVTLTIRGVVNAGVWKGLPFSAPRKIFDCTGTGEVVGLRNVYPEWWGAVADGATDSIDGLQAAHDCAEAGETSDGGRPTIWLDGGTYTVSTVWEIRPTSTFNVRVVGAGSVLGTRITARATFTGTDTIRLAGQTVGSNVAIADFAISGFSVTRASGSGAQTGIQVGESGKHLIGTQHSKFEDVYVEDFPKCWDVVNSRLISFFRCSGWCENTTNGIGLLIRTVGASSFTGDFDFWSCQFVPPDESGKSVALNSKVSGGQIKGIRFHGAIYYGGDRFVEIYATSGGVIGDVWFNPGCQWDGDISSGRNMLWIEASGSGSRIDDIHVTGCYFRGVSLGCMAIRTLTDGVGAIENLFIDGNWIANCADRALYLANVTGLSVEGNQFHDINNANQVVLIDASGRWSFNGNKLTRSGSQVTPYLLTIGSGQDYYTAVANIGGGIVSTGVVQDLSAGTNSYKAGNI